MDLLDIIHHKFLRINPKNRVACAEAHLLLKGVHEKVHDQSGFPDYGLVKKKTPPPRANTLDSILQPEPVSRAGSRDSPLAQIISQNESMSTIHSNVIAHDTSLAGPHLEPPSRVMVTGERTGQRTGQHTFADLEEVETRAPEPHPIASPGLLHPPAESDWPTNRSSRSGTAASTRNSSRVSTIRSDPSYSKQDEIDRGERPHPQVTNNGGQEEETEDMIPARGTTAGEATGPLIKSKKSLWKAYFGSLFCGIVPNKRNGEEDP